MNNEEKILALIADIQANMTTKTDLAEIRADMADMKADSADMRADMADMKADSADMRANMATKADLAAQEKRILSEAAHTMNVIIETTIQPQLNLLAEGQQAILGKLVPRSRVDELDEEVKFLKSVVRQMNDDIQLLKKAQ